MPQGQAEPGHRTFIATVVFIDIVGYSERPVAQQVEIKTRLNAMVAAVLEHVPVTDRMMLDTGDGAALCFLGDPEDARVRREQPARRARWPSPSWPSGSGSTSGRSAS